MPIRLNEWIKRGRSITIGSVNVTARDDDESWNTMQMRPIILIGFMGTGKSTVGAELAQRLRCRFIDLDEVLVQRVGKRITRIFEQEGERYFRKQESLVLCEIISNNSRFVLATGGGIVLQATNRELIRSSGYVVHLFADLKTIVNRISQAGNRPLLQGDVTAYVTHFMQQRIGLYDFAHLCVATDEKTPAQIAIEIKSSIDSVF